ncbi:putative integral membrane protein [Candida parapsilosis]|uniref:Uncharacterized protein n=2 Tax=Candida parapsilosis TaxID=5480 RepID=G8B8B2_CANPC|nr:uncharacterized protein CPAR2_107320 [Candida parapsilosis]KAF6043063.1 hypothetical protein FOB59_005146 [Candida parapsilosis]KAF6049359.1 putative integral membrane protein [Candida parapsilosis]KAF6057210.1 putative integral membrane protein [Candida parapsilosis]KAF6066071.1 putative integral membrane protein [Candida parapsilosis]KAI5904364.1 hypothetical protein K4G60_g3522 [Candida parapsilosis]
MKKLKSQDTTKDRRDSAAKKDSEHLDPSQGRPPTESQSQSQHVQQPTRPSESHAPSTSSSMQTFDDVYSPNQQKTVSTSSSDSKLTPEFTSPTKSLKTFLFKNRLSSYSIDSISEEPELEPQVTKESKSATIQSAIQDLTPTKSPSRLLNFNLRPKFIRSRSSGLSDTGANPPLTPTKYTSAARKRVTIDDFADTESEESGTSSNQEAEGDPEEIESPILFDETFDESVNSVLQEYHNRDSDVRTKSMFLESDLRPKSGELSLHESEQLKSDIIRQGSVKSIGTKTGPSSDRLPSAKQQLYIDAKASQEHFKQGNIRVDQQSPTIFKRVSAPSDESSPKTPRSDRDSSGSAVSLRFRVHGDQIEPIKSKARHTSSATTTTNAETNRSSLRASITLSDDSEVDDGAKSKYPEPTITPLATPRVNYSDNRHSSSTEYTNRSSINDSAIAGSLPNTSSSGGGGGSGGRHSSPQVHPSVLRHSLADDSISISGDEYHFDEETIANKTNVLNFSNTHTFDETMLKSEDTKHSSVARSSMSSGELLRNLVGSSYDQTRSSDNSDSIQRPTSQYREGKVVGSRPVSMSGNISKPAMPMETPLNLSSENIYPNLPSKQRLPRIDSSQTVNNMTAGLDATNELPIMLYKIHNKDYDESKNRWSVYENRNSQNTQNAAKAAREEVALSTRSGSESNSPDANAALTPKPETSQAGSISGSSGVGTRSATRSSHTSSTSSPLDRQLDNQKDLSSGIPQQQSVQRPTQEDPQMPGQPLVLSQPKRNLFLNDRQPSTNMMDPEKHTNNFTYPRDQTYLPRQQKQEGEYDSPYHFIPYSMLQFSLLMLVGLVAPPIYFLTTLGLFDGKDNQSSYYGGMTSYKVNSSNRGVYVKKFTKSQKIISFVIGLVWVLIVLAMIGVGLGVGLTRGR